jgi:HK97 family phage prohead protease
MMSTLRLPFNQVRAYPFEYGVPDEGREIEGMASTPQPDSYGTVMESQAFDTLDQYLANPVVSYAHNWEKPIGWTLKANATKAGLKVRIAIADADELQHVREAWAMIKHRLVRHLSLGWNGWFSDEFGHLNEKTGLWHWTHIDLKEIAVTPLGATPGAEFDMARALGLEGQSPPEKERGATSFADLSLAPEGHRWDASAARKRVAKLAGAPNAESIDWTQYGKAFLWHNSADADSFGAYQLPFADVIDGELRAAWPGCAAAMATLLGGRGGGDIPDADRRNVYNHLKRYYSKFEKDVPEFEGREGEGPLPVGWDSVTFRSGEQDHYEEAVTSDNITVALARLTGTRNLVKGWKARGYQPTPELARDMAGRARIMAQLAVETSNLRGDIGEEAAAEFEAILRNIRDGVGLPEDDTTEDPLADLLTRGTEGSDPFAPPADPLADLFTGE